ncbi:hypothetical protein AB0F81_28705 [Actinoplanes sp. NPDC024001]|uniref:hypothetical protein n=1 Tax=Actinoplanes sp. NPDC024001 TaxID=3154598 RepID=UPI0033CB4AC3
MRQFSVRSDTRRSGIQDGKLGPDKPGTPGNQTTTSRGTRGSAPASQASAGRGTRGGASGSQASAGRGTRGGALGGGRQGASGSQVTAGRGTRGVLGSGKQGKTGAVEGTAALALEVTELEVTAAAPQPAGRPRLWVAPPAPIRAPRATFAAAVIAVVLVGVLGILLINTKTMEQSFRLDALRKEKVALDKQQQGLEQQLIQASNPGNLQAAARRLGLVPADAPAMIRLPDGKIIRTPTPGRGQPAVTAQDGLTNAGTPTTGTGR